MKLHLILLWPYILLYLIWNVSRSVATVPVEIGDPEAIIENYSNSMQNLSKLRLHLSCARFLRVITSLVSSPVHVSLYRAANSYSWHPWKFTFFSWNCTCHSYVSSFTCTLLILVYKCPFKSLINPSKDEKLKSRRILQRSVKRWSV